MATSLVHTTWHLKGYRDELQGPSGMLQADSWHKCAELRQMRIKAETDKKEAALAEASMKSIESAARKAYEKDLAAQKANATANGDWVGPPTTPVLMASFFVSPVELEITGAH